MASPPSCARCGGHHHADQRQRIHRDCTDEDQRLSHGRQHALPIEGTRQHPIIDQLELLVAGGLYRKAAHPQSIEEVGNPTDQRHRPEGGRLKGSTLLLPPAGLHQHKDKYEASGYKNQP